MECPLISVVVSVYNIGGYVEKCLKSLITQSYENIEVIVVDDGSTDGSGEICDKIATSDERIRVFHKKNGGISDARNYGIKKARGTIVALIDGDDYVRKDYIKVMHVEMEKTDADIVICGYNDVVPEKVLMSGEDATVRLLVGQENLEIVAWNKLYRKSLFDRIKYPVGEVNEDSLMTYKLLAETKKVAYVDKTLYVYVERGDSTMATEKVERRLKNRERAAKEAMEYFDKNKKLKDAAGVSLLTAKYAFVDAAIKGEISKNFYDKNVQWINRHKNIYKGNPFINKKLKLYMILCSLGLYRVFRKVV